MNQSKERGREKREGAEIIYVLTLASGHVVQNAFQPDQSGRGLWIDRLQIEAPRDYS